MQMLMHLKEKFELPGAVIFDEGKGGLLRCSIDTGAATAEVYLHGATTQSIRGKTSRP